MPGLIIDGNEVAVDGLNIINGNDESWATLDSSDYGRRTGRWVRQVILHTTKGNWPQSVLPGAGAGGRARSTANYWRSEQRQAGAHLIIDNDGTVACLADLQTAATWHATVSNQYSIGIEMYQEGRGSDGTYGVYEAVYNSAVILVPALCRLFGIQFQIPSQPYNNHPLRRMLNGGRDVVGVLGHRNNTENRGHGDPGDEVFDRLAAAGAERYDYDAGEDLDTWKTRQQQLVANGATLDPIDGIIGPASIAAIKAAGSASGCWVLDPPTLP